jgi:hypothetical protein
VKERKRKCGFAFYKKLTNSALKDLLDNANIQCEETLTNKKDLIELLINHDDNLNSRRLDEESAARRWEDDESDSDHDADDDDHHQLTEVTIEDIETGRVSTGTDSLSSSSSSSSSSAAKRTCT